MAESDSVILKDFFDRLRSEPDSVSLRDFFEEKFSRVEDKLKSLENHSNLRFDSLNKTLIDRDHRSSEREVSNKDAIKAAFNASEKAAEKTEAALKEYKIGSNEWRNTLGDLVNKMVTKSDVEKEIEPLKDQISDLKEYRSKNEGRDVQKVETRTQSNWSTGLTIVTILSSLSLIMMVIHLVKG